ncbi:hypothetical protein H351_32445 (plasmid) [Rhodococcus erythropolis R138]|uniref:hypothetical protein n=1 Tax=Rhodococcus erythropolis TaxID=1833 RepID=UPI0004A8740C|nr:hypothetical protein [Rhodococcus erythropolis]ALU73650.1 hypothetical protein H351_32445 [Rhodococcus erythropolis R138]
MSIATRSSPSTFTACALTAGHRVQFVQPADLWWTVRAVSEDHQFVVLTRPNPEGEGVIYTIIDNNRGVRGPANIWRNGYETDDQIARSLSDLVDGRSEVSRLPSRWEQTRIAAVLLPVSPPCADVEQR